MRELKALNRYFLQYKWRLLTGIAFVVLSNYFGILAPQLTGYVVDRVTHQLTMPAIEWDRVSSLQKTYFDPLVTRFIDWLESSGLSFTNLVLFCGLWLIGAALLRGFFMFLMRQTIIVMSRHIEFDQKNEVYQQYQKLDPLFFKTNSTGDLMSRISEDVSRVRMYTGPSIMYLANLVVLISLSLYYMFREDAMLTLYVLSPLPILAYAIYYVNTIIHQRSEKIQSELGELTSVSQESYSGIRVIKSYVQELSMSDFFSKISESYRKSALGLATVEAIYFPSISLLIGISTLLTICIGGIYQVEHTVSPGTIAAFVIYINMLTFPVSAIGWVASMIQRAAASQKRLNDFLTIEPALTDHGSEPGPRVSSGIVFDQVSFTYPHTRVQALKNICLSIPIGQKIAILGKTGSGKSTLGQMLLRFYDPDEGSITIGKKDLRDLSLRYLRKLISYVPQDVFLFSDTIANNIRFGNDNLSDTQVADNARLAAIDEEIMSFPEAYHTMIGERGVNLSGGQKQRISIARAISGTGDILLFDDCLSAVDARTEHRILNGLRQAMDGKTTIIITHRIISQIEFDQIFVMENGQIMEHGTHSSLIRKKGAYYEIFQKQKSMDASNPL